MSLKSLSKLCVELMYFGIPIAGTVIWTGVTNKKEQSVT